MATIKQLSEADIVENGDQFPFFSEAQGDTRKVTFATLKDSVATDFVSAADLAAQTGATLVGCNGGTTVQQELDAKVSATLDTDGTLAANSDARVASQKATKTYVDAYKSAIAASAGSSLAGYIASGTGATARTVQAKLRDTVSVKDFGAVGDGAANDTAAIAAAAAAHKALVWPAGTYMVDVLPNPQAGAIWIADGEVIIRRRAASSSNVILLASNKIECVGITFDGNKANNAIACNTVIITASESRFERCKFINAKTVAGGFGSGISYDETTVTANSSHVLLDCQAYANDAQGFTGQNMRGLEAIANTAYSNGKSGFEFNNYDLTLTKKLFNCRLIGNYAYSNGENGIYVGNFIESNNLSVLDYGPTNLESYRFVIEGNLCLNNNFYGIAAQGESLLVSGNICVSNAQTDPSTGGILMNAVRSACLGNLVSSNLGFGIDCGGSEYSLVSQNNIYVNSGTGVNAGATVNTAVKGNHVYGNGGASGIQIEAHNVDTDAAGRALPKLTTALAITQNHIILTSAGQRGVYLHDGVAGVNVCDNDFYGTVPANFIIAIAFRPIIKGNRFPVELSHELTVSGGGVIAIPDVFDYGYTNSTTTVTSLDYHTAQSVVGRTGVGWVTVTNGGSGYTSAPTVVFTGGGGSNAAATAHIRNGVVIGVRMTNFGTGYTSAPAVSFTGGGGSSAAGTAQVCVPLNDFREIEIETLQACTINRAGTPVVESKAAANLSMSANDGVRLRSKFGQWYAGARYG